MNNRVTTVFSVFAFILVIASGSARGQDLLGSLIEQAGTTKLQPNGSVEVLSWIDRSNSAPALVVSFATEGDVKLVADPGIVVEPLGRNGLTWDSPEPVEKKTVGLDYFSAPPVIKLPFAEEDGEPIEARVEYAYCFVDYQCLFGEQIVSAGTKKPAS